MAEREDASLSTKLTYLLIGAGIGAVVALLLAPKSGKELREDLADATRKGLEKGKEAAAQLQEKAGEYYEVTKEKASELYHTAQEKAEELAEKAKEVATKATTPITAAVEAGKQAYLEEKRKTEASIVSEGHSSYSAKEKTSKSKEN